MSHIAISIAVADPAELSHALDRAEAALKNGARLVEWRVDELAQQASALVSIQRLVRDSPMPSIVTIRSATEGGMYQGDDENRAEVLAGLIQSDEPPRYIDVEWRAFQKDGPLREYIIASMDAVSVGNSDRQASLIASVHDFSGRPAHLIQSIEQMTLDAHVNVIKIAWTARSLRDNVEAFDLLAERRKPMIALCMGQFGLMSRVLAPKFGGLITYASDTDESATAPGQPTLQQLRDIYHFDQIGPKTKVYGVIGWPVEHSLSPRFHNKAFETTNFDGVYLPMPIPGGPEEYEHFKATVGSMIEHPKLDFRGASVTIPHKETLVQFVKERAGGLDIYSRRVNAANTLIIDAYGKMACANTDVPAAVQSFCAGIKINESDLNNKRIAVLGAGGVARAVIAGFADAGAHVVIYNRSIEKAQSLVDDLKSRRPAHSIGDVSVADPSADKDKSRFDAIINCTPVGMASGLLADASPLDILTNGTITLDASMTVMDTVYAPPDTPLVKQTEAAGVRTIRGLDMFLRQAALQSELWTGTTLPKSAAAESSQ